MSDEQFDFDSIDIDDIVVDIKDIQQKVKERESEGGGSKNDRYFWGMGTSIVRGIPYWDSVRQVWEICRKVTVHKKFLNGKDVVCKRQTHGEDCEICNLYFELGKNRELFPQGFKDAAFKGLVKSTGLGTTDYVWINLQIVEDSGDKGGNGFDRPEYPKGHICFGSMPYTLYGHFLSKYSDPDYKSLTSPTQGRDLKVILEPDPKTKRNNYGLNVRPDPRPIAESKEARRDILKQCKDFSTWYPVPTGETAAAIALRLEAIQIKAENPDAPEESAPKEAGKPEDAMTPPEEPKAPKEEKPVQETGGDDGESVEDEETYTPSPKTEAKASKQDDKPSEQEAKGDSVKPDVNVSDLKPSPNRENGIRVCMNKGVRDDSNFECQLCEAEGQCDRS